MSAKVQSTPPQLPGLTYVQPIGTGGFADVFLYRQALPARQVAVKVLRAGGDEAGLAQFHAEANVMAQLSGHPSIVPIFTADVSADGRAFLVMEYCPGPHLAQRFRTERIGVPEVLEIAVRIASAVETAHRAGILHRDIKPHNILTSTYGAPLLTDFGIATAAGEDLSGQYGMSVPWSPPEAFRGIAAPDVRSDVFALGATTYSLLAGRSPYEVPGAANDAATLIHRIETSRPSRVLRADVPDELNDLLQRAMAHDLADRPPSAMAFARAIQEIQIQLHLTPTRLEVLDASPEAAAGGGGQVQDERTLVKPVQVIIPDEIAERGTLLRPRAIQQPDDHTSVHPSRMPAPDTVQQRQPAPAYAPPVAGAPLPPPPPAATGPRPAVAGERMSRRPLLVGAALVLVLAAVAAGALIFGAQQEKLEPADAPTPGGPVDVVNASPAAPEDVKLKRIGAGVEVTWTNPDPQPGDRFQVLAGPSRPGMTALPAPEQPRIVVADIKPGGVLCYQITVVRSGVPSEKADDCKAVR